MQDKWKCKKSAAGPAEQRIPCVPRERGDKIISRDPKWAVLWRCWKKPFSGAAANSVQVQIIDLDPRWEERQTFMSNQVGTKRRWPLFIGTSRRCSLRRTQSARCHILSLSCSPPDTALSVNLRWLLCVPVWFSVALHPHHCCCFLGMCLLVLAGRTAELRRNVNALCCSAGRGAELMHKMRPHRGDSIVGCCVPAHSLHLAARLLFSTRYLSLQHVITVVSVGHQLSLLWFHKLLSQGRAADIVWGTQPLRDHMGKP